MRRRYAFEAEELAPEVKAQLEKVEDVVEDKCSTPDACNKMLDKIDAETEKFNCALKDMAGAAKDCKDGKCDKAEMAAQISPKMAELKEVAKSIGVASEGENLTEDELKKAKAYLEGAKEIVEAKLDEVGSDSGKEEPKENPDEEGDEKGDHEEPDGDEVEGDESWIVGTESMSINDPAFESAMDDAALECFVAMEGYNWDQRADYRANLKAAKAKVKEAKAAAKSGDEAKTKKLMTEVVDDLTKAKKDFVEAQKDQTAINAICGYYAYAFRGFGLMMASLIPTLGIGYMAVAVKHSIEFWVDLIQVISKLAKKEGVKPSDFNMYTKSMEHNMDVMIDHYKSAAKKLSLKAAKNAPKETSAEGASESDLGFDDFIAACESAIIAKPAAETAPYLFG